MGCRWVDFFKGSLVSSKLCRPLGWGVPGREVSDYKDLEMERIGEWKEEQEGQGC